MSGTGHSTFDVIASGDPRIDGILNEHGWADVTITYSFPLSNAEYGIYAADEDEGHFAATAAMQQVASRALDADLASAAQTGFTVEGFTLADIALTTADQAHIRISQTTEDPYNYQTAWGFYPSAAKTGGDVWLTNVRFDFSNPQPGNYAQLTLMHEIGHALGLEHGHEVGTFGLLPQAYDALEYTIMTYRSFVGTSSLNYSNETWGYAQSWMMQDIAALQHLYGADFTTNAGNTVYSWSPSSGATMVDAQVAISPGSNRIFATIWDGGGIDTYDLSAYVDDLDVDLAPGGHSRFSATQTASLASGVTASGNIYNALLHQGDLRSLIENAIGGAGNDTLRGNQANNTLTGGDGGDTLSGNEGRDRLFGQNGDDTLIGGDGDDLLRGGAGDDTLNGGTDDDRLYGDSGIDLILGGAGNDALYGGGRADLLRGGGGADSLYGGTGNDRLYGDASDDLLIGSDGSDVMHGGGRNDTLRGGAGDDRLFGGTGNDLMYGDSGADTLIGSDGNDLMHGGGQADTLRGGSGNDQLWGDAGDDQLLGDSGSDTLDGGGGKDDLIGGSGADFLTGGADADVFRFVKATDSPGGAVFDTILDFVVGLDLIDLTALTQSTATIAVGGGFSGSGPTVITQEFAADTFVFVDLNGDFASDMTILVQNTLGLTVSDFIF
jgi:serralysin